MVSILIKSFFILCFLFSSIKVSSQKDSINIYLDSCRMGDESNIPYYANKVIEITNETLYTDPNDSAVYYQKGYANYLLGIHLYNIEEYENSITYLVKAIEPFEELDSLSKLAKTFGQLGINWYLLGDNKKAIDYYQKESNIYKRFADDISNAKCISKIGIVFYTEGNSKKGLEYFFKSLKLSNQTKDSSAIPRTQNLIGNVYYDLGDTINAAKYFKKSLEIRLKMKDDFGIAESYNSLGTLYQDLQENETALDYYNQSLIIRKRIQDKQGIGELLINIGTLHLGDSNWELAEKHFKKGLEVFLEIKLAQGQSIALFNLGVLYKKTNQLTKAEAVYKQSLQLSQDIGYPHDIKDAANELSFIYKKKKRFENALEMYELYIEMRDSINSEDFKNAAIEQQVKYEYEKQKVTDNKEHEKQIAIETANHEKELAIKQEEKEKKNIVIYSISFGLIILCGFLFFIFNRLRITQRQKGEINRQKLRIEQTHYELEEKNQEILDSINYAKRIQSAILPPTKLVKEYLQQSFILYKPKDIVAGDFYWMEHQNNKVLFAAADCTGHGVPGAMVSVVCNNALNRSVREYGLTDPGEILDKTREIVINEFDKSEEDVKDGMDIALCSLDGNNLKYTGANNPLWIIRKGSDTIEETKANKQPIGKFDLTTPYTTHTFDLEKGDSVYIFSDGFVDQFGGPKGKKFKAKAFRELLLSIQDIPMEKQGFLIDKAFENWRGEIEQIDDVCVIGVKI